VIVQDQEDVSAYRSFASDADLRLAGAQVLQAAKGRVVQVLDLAAAEARLAAMSGLSMLLMITVAAAALIIAWALVVAVAIYGFLLMSISWPVTAIALALVHVGVAYLLWRTTVKLSRNLTLPQLRRVMVPTGTRPASEVDDVEADRSARAR
jgi:hypothetical protein